MIFPRRAIFLRTGFDPLAYANTILGTETANLIGYWPLWEASGATADNYQGTAARDGSYTGVTLGQTGIGDGNTSVLVDGANDYVNIFSESLQAVFSGAAGTMVIWAKVSGVGVWTDGAARKLFYLAADADNRIYFERPTSDSRLQLMYRASASSYAATVDGLSTTDWFHLAITWDKSAGATGEVKQYYNGSQQGDTDVGLNDFVGAISMNYSLVGALTKVPSQVWDGYLAHAALWNKALTPAQIAALAVI